MSCTPDRILVVAGLIRASAHAARFLIARRGPGGRHGGAWEFPGGKLEVGEAPEDGLRRELREELSIEVEVGDVFAVGHDAEGNPEIVMMTYECVHVGGEPQCVGVADWRWVETSALVRMNMPPVDRAVLARLRRIGCRA